jgi:hypothetical protein
LSSVSRLEDNASGFNWVQLKFNMPPYSSLGGACAQAGRALGRLARFIRSRATCDTGWGPGGGRALARRRRGASLSRLGCFILREMASRRLFAVRRGRPVASERAVSSVRAVSQTEGADAERASSSSPSSGNERLLPEEKMSGKRPRRGAALPTVVAAETSLRTLSAVQGGGGE